MSTRTVLLSSAVAACLFAAAPAAAGAADYIPPNAPDTAGLPASCSELVNGSTGGRGRPAGSVPPVLSGPATAAPTSAEAQVLPQVVRFRTDSESWNARYDVAARQGHLFIRGHAADGRGTAPWRRLVLPACMEGRMTGVGVDGELLIATDAKRNVYDSTGADDPVEDIYSTWTMRWGPLFWAGKGVRLPKDTRTWATSNGDANIDKWFLDGAGNQSPVIGIATVYALRGDGSHITLLDPWLPADEAYEVCAPQRGRLRSAGMSAAGSTILLAGRDGNLYTRQYDFDISGADIVQLRYAWDSQKGVADPKIQLPARGWDRQPRIRGRFTSRVSIEKTGQPGSAARILRVEGLDTRGRTGYWEKPIATGTWRFVATGARLEGKLVKPGSGALARAQELTYAGRLADGTRVEVSRYNPHCSPATLRLTTRAGHGTQLTLHGVDGLRQLPIPAGLSEIARWKYAAIEATPAAWKRVAAGPADVRALVTRIMGASGTRFREVTVQATRGTLWFDKLCWRLRRTGAKVPAGTVDPQDGCPAR